MNDKHKPLFTNPKILQETDWIDQLIPDQEPDKNRLKSILRGYINDGHNRMVAYLGPFGSGKSTIVHNATNELRNVHVYDFDLWQYHDDRSIWDAFTIGAAAVITDDDKEDIAQEIDGKPSDGVAMIYRHPIISLLLAFVLYFIVAHLVWSAFRDNEFIQPFLIYAMPTFFSVVALFGITAIFPQSKSPATRTYQYENKLASHLADLDKPLIVIVDGVDRSEYGQHFLETLHVYLEQLHKLPHPVIVICPQQAMTIGMSSTLDNTTLERATKVYDEIINSFIRPTISTQSVVDLLHEAGCTDQLLIDIARRAIQSANYLDQPVSIRTVKLAIRETRDFIRQYPSLNPSVAFLLSFSKYLTDSDDQHCQRLSLALRDILSGDNTVTISADSRSSVNTFLSLLLQATSDESDDNQLEIDGTYLQLLFWFNQAAFVIEYS